MTPPWLLLIHVLPGRPTGLRVKTWRRLQELGAVSLKHAVWVLPNTEQAREDFEWMRTEVRQMGGEATVMAADGIDAFSSDRIVSAFRQAREPDFTAIERDARRLAAKSRAARTRELPRLGARLDRLEAITFYPPRNRAQAVDLVARLQAEAAGQTRTSAGSLDPTAFRHRVWVTRPRPGVDRMASAWLIRRFIDAKATFAFVERLPADPRQVPFDMFGVEFGHGEHGCTFETLVARFGLGSPAVDRIARIVHDVDLKDSKFQPAEAPGIAPVIEGLRQTVDHDAELLERGIAIFEALHRSFAVPARPRVRGSRRRRAATKTARPARKARR